MVPATIPSTTTPPPINIAPPKPIVKPPIEAPTKEQATADPNATEPFVTNEPAKYDKPDLAAI